VKEPERKEDKALDARIQEPEITPDEQLAAAPKAYAFDGWSMVPLAPESA